PRPDVPRARPRAPEGARGRAPGGPFGPRAVREGPRTAPRPGRPCVAGLRRSARSPRLRRRGPSAPLAHAGVAPDPRGALGRRRGPRRGGRSGRPRLLVPGTTRLPLDRFTTEAFPGAERIRLTTRHRSVSEPSVEAWIAPHTSEEHAAVARELRRLHVEEGVAWSDLAVVVRRQGAHVGNLLRALDDAQVPRVVPERGLSLGTAPSTHPYVLALRWL